MTPQHDAESARQGHTGDHLRYILIVSLALAATAMIAAAVLM